MRWPPPSARSRTASGARAEQGQLAVAGKTVNSKIPAFQDAGGYIGASVSGTFLLLIGLLNLFGLGFDTASEIGLLAIAAGVATHGVPFLAILSLPVIFAAGMCLMDTADGAFMSQAYGWAFSNPVRKVCYNLTAGRRLDFGTIGYLVVGLFVLASGSSVIVWKSRRIEARWGGRVDRR